MTPPASPHRDRVLELIAVLKFCKAALLIAAGLGALKLIQPGFDERAESAVSALFSPFMMRQVERLLSRVSDLRPGQLEALAVAAFLYAALFIVEGIGLWREKRWAEYLTAIATSSFIPFELFELFRRFTALRVGMLVLNVTVVAYLVFRLRQDSRKE